MSKVIFLDIDGVLHPLGPNHLPLVPIEALIARTEAEDTHLANPISDWKLPILPGEFTADCVGQLGRVLSHTHAKIVLSSSWRLQPHLRAAVNDELARLLPQLNTEIVGYTPVLGSGGALGRSDEISAWLAQHPVDSWVAIDDAALDTLPDGRRVKTAMEQGFTSNDADRAIEILNQANR